MTEGRDIADAIEMARDYIGTYSLSAELPPSETTLPAVNADSLATLVTVNISAYRRRHDKKVVKKTITIPNYLNELGKEQQVNFSELMTQALGDANDHRSYRATSRNLYAGKVLAIVQMTGETGEVSVTASAENLTSATVTFPSHRNRREPTNDLNELSCS